MGDKELEAVRLVQTQLDKHGQLLAILTRRDGGDNRQALRDAESYVRAAIRALADVAHTGDTRTDTPTPFVGPSPEASEVR